MWLQSDSSSFENKLNLQASQLGVFCLACCLISSLITWSWSHDCCCSVIKSCPTLWDPMDCCTPGSPVLHFLPEFAQTHVYWFGYTTQPSHLLLPPYFPNFNLFQHQSLPMTQLFASGGQSFRASASTSVLLMNIWGWFPSGLISFRIDYSHDGRSLMSPERGTFELSFYVLFATLSFAKVNQKARPV